MTSISHHDLLAQIRIVLVNTCHPGNIGSVARAMKTMGLQNLYLVAPKRFPATEATYMAAGATDVLLAAQIVPNLDTALQDCQVVFGTSARLRTFSMPVLSARACGEKLVQEAVQHPVAILFGREDAGLSNEEFTRCHYQIHIPSNPDYNVLNLAAAAQIICYECRVALGDSVNAICPRQEPYASHLETQLFYQQLEQMLVQLKFLDPGNPRQLMPRLKRLFNRVRLEQMEINILRGILTTIQKISPH